MSWEYLTQILSLTGVKDATVWQGVFFSVILVPFFSFLLYKIWIWWKITRPLNMLFKDCLGENNDVYIFYSQMSGADQNYIFTSDQKYITRFPEPLPTDHANLAKQLKRNIDPVTSEAELECLVDVYNILGIVGKIRNIHLGDLINDWNIWSCPIISIGFNPKTIKLSEKCKPIFYKLGQNELSIKGSNLKLKATDYNDAGIFQKTFIKGSRIPVFILAGLGTMGTSITGHYLNKKCIDLGKLYGDKPFCVLLSGKINEGRRSVIIRAAYPKPRLVRRILYYLTYCKFNRDSIFPR